MAVNGEHPARQRPAGFDFTAHMRRLCGDIAARLPEARHIDVGRIAFAFAQARKRVQHGIHATLTPMRFEHGAMTAVRGGQRYAVQRFFDANQREMLYILTFYLPRFQDAPFEEKLVTVFHELWHISPEFNGDLRRLPGRCYQHSHSQKKYDAAMSRLAERWLALDPPESLYAFLKLPFDQLQRRHGRVIGSRAPHPRLIPLDPSSSP